MVFNCMIHSILIYAIGVTIGLTVWTSLMRMLQPMLYYVSTWLGKHEVDIVMFKSVVLYSMRFCILCGITTTFMSSVRYMR